MDAILPYWPMIVSLLCGLLLAAVILALIFKQDFRKDVTAKQGKAHLFNVVSVFVDEAIDAGVSTYELFSSLRQGMINFVTATFINASNSK